MFFVGVDLAWSERNYSGIAIIKGQKDRADFVCGTSDIYKNNEIVNYIITHTKGNPTLIAIDASLIVNNNSGERKAETLLKEKLFSYDAVPYPSDRNLFYRIYGGIRGEQIAKMLQEKSFQHNPFIQKFKESRKFFEVFPHSAMVVIFKLKKILKYKSRNNRDYNFRWQEFEKYQLYLRSLKNRKPALNFSCFFQMLKTNVRILKGNALKKYEDFLDAVFCAYVAFYYWYDPGKWSVIGDLNEGTIVTPIFEDIDKP
jgi:predicted RNase H-like nuclease